MRKKVAFGFSAGIVSLGIDGLTGLLLLRLLVEYLPPTIAGYWILVASAGSFLILLQCGLGPTVARRVAQSLSTSNTEEMQALLVDVARSFRYIVYAVLVVAVIIYALYLRRVGTEAKLADYSSLAWFLYAFGMASNLHGQASLFVLNGYGEVGWDKALRAVFTAGGFLLVWLALHLGGQLVSIGAIYLAQNLFFAMAARAKLKAMTGHTLKAEASGSRPSFSRLFVDGSKLLLLNILTYCITQFTVFVAERHFGMHVVAGYSALLRVGMLIATVGALIPQMLFPYVAAAWAKHDYRACRVYYLTGLGSSVLLSLALSVLVYSLADPIFNFWLGPGKYLGNHSLAVMLLFYLVYVHHSAHATPTLAVSGNAFTMAAILNGVLVALLLLWLPGIWGIPGIPLAMILGTLPSSVYVARYSWRLFMHPTASQI